MTTISKQQQKYIQSLHNKKYRKQFGQFIVEGRKSMLELPNSGFEIISIYIAKEEDLNYYPEHLTHLVDGIVIQKVSSMQNNTYGVAIVKTKEEVFPKKIENWVLMADDVRDPGNLGTMIRLADWYGIEHLICSTNTVDFQNPKVIASTMGSYARVKIWYLNLEQTIDELKLPVFAASMEGRSAYNFKFPSKGILLMGSESHGISRELKKKVNDVIAIPAFGKAESLNVAVATGILLDNIKRATVDQTFD